MKFIAIDNVLINLENITAIKVEGSCLMVGQTNAALFTFDFIEEGRAIVAMDEILERLADMTVLNLDSKL